MALQSAGRPLDHGVHEVSAARLCLKLRWLAALVVANRGAAACIAAQLTKLIDAAVSQIRKVDMISRESLVALSHA